MLETRPSLRSANWLYLVSLVLIVSVGSLLQSRSMGWGLLATEFLLILLPALWLIWRGRLEPRAVLRLRWPEVGPVLLGLAIGAGIWGLGIALQGVASVLMGYAPQSPLTSISTDPLNLVVFAVAMMVAAPVCEEIFFRGYLLSAYGRYRPAVAVLSVALLFAFFHQQFQGLFALLPIALALSYLAQRSNSLAPSIAAHMANNALGGLLIIAVRLNPALPSQPALTTMLCSAMVAGPLIALAGLWAFHRAIRAPAEIPTGPAASSPAVPARPLSRGTYWPLAGAGAIWLVLAALEVIMGRFPQVLAQSTLQLKPAPWSQPVRLAYNLFNVANEQVGEAACMLTPQGEAVAFLCTTRQRHFEARQGSSTFAGGRYELRQTGRWDAASVRLLKAHLEFVGEYGGWTADVAPGGNALYLTLGKQPARALPSNPVIAAMWPWQMMALPFGQSMYFGSRINLVRLGAGDESGNSETGAVLVRGQEDLLTPPSGHALAWKVTVGQQTAWYAATAPHTLLRYNDGYGVTWIITPVPPGGEDE